MGHILIFFYILVLISGIAAALTIHLMSKIYGRNFLKDYAQNIIFFNLIVFVQLSSYYLHQNYFDSATSTGFLNIYNITTYLIGFTGALGMAYSFVKVVFGLLGKSLPPFVKKTFLTGLVVLAVSYGIGIALFLQQREMTWLFNLRNIVNMALGWIILLSLLFLFYKGNRLPDRKQKHITKVFALIYLSGVLGLIIAIFIDFALEDLFVPLFFLLMNLFPFMWFYMFFKKAFGTLILEPAEESIIERAVKEYKISEREREVLERLLKGFNHKQIQEELFISFHTVKNHIYSLYKKLEVSSRWELMRFFKEMNK